MGDIKALFKDDDCGNVVERDHFDLDGINKSSLKLSFTMLLTGLQLYCIEKLKEEERDKKFPLERRQELAKQIKNNVKQMTKSLLGKGAEEFKLLGVALRDYESTLNRGGQFQLESLAKAITYYYRDLASKITLEDPDKQKKPNENPDNQKKPDENPDNQKKPDENPDNQKKPDEEKKIGGLEKLDEKYSKHSQYEKIINITKEKLDEKLTRYLEKRRNSNSLYSISRGLESILESIKVKKTDETAAEEKRLAVQEALRLTGEYLKGTDQTPNLDATTRTQLNNFGIPVENLTKFRDMLTHKHLFPLIEDEIVDKIIGTNVLSAVKDIIDSEIVESEHKFIKGIIDENFEKIKNTSFRQHVSRKEETTDSSLDITDGAKSIPDLITTLELIKKEGSYQSLEAEDKALVDEIYENAQQMNSNRLTSSKIEPVSKIEFDNRKKLISSSLNVYIDTSEQMKKLTAELKNDVIRKVKGLESIDDKKLNPLCKDIINGKATEKSVTKRLNNLDIKDKEIIEKVSEDTITDLKNFYSTKIEFEFNLLKKLENSYAIKSQILNLYDIVERRDKFVRMPKKINEGDNVKGNEEEKGKGNEEDNVKGNEEEKGKGNEEDNVKGNEEEKGKGNEEDNVTGNEEEKGKGNEEDNVKGDEKGEIEKLKATRNFLSHGSALVSVDDDHLLASDIAKLLREGLIEELENIVLQKKPITLQEVEKAIESVRSDDRIKKVIGEVEALICGNIVQSGRRRRRRSANGSCLTWEEIDKFNEGGAENRDPGNIIIDSEKFISSISNELEANAEKFSNLVALASESEVIGDHKNKVNMLTDNHRYLGHLERVGKVSGMVMHGMIAKNMIGDLLSGNYEDLAINLGFLAGSQGLSKVAEAASLKGAGYMLEGRALLGKSLRFASPFLARGVTAFIAFDLYNQVKEYEKGNKDALVPIIGDSLQVGVDSIELGIEIGEALGLELLEGVSAVTGPVGMVIGALVFVGTEVYMAVRTVEKIDEQIHLTGWEKFSEGWRAFLRMQPAEDIKSLIEEKRINNEAVINAISYLKDNPYVRRYVFPSWRVDHKIILDNVVLLDQKRNDIQWSRTRPDNLDGVNLFCLPKGNWESVPTSGTYYCDGAIGVEYPNSRTGDYTLISLGDGKDKVNGFQDSSNIFVLGDGHKEMTGGNKNDNFIFGGKSVNAPIGREIKGSIDGRGGINTIDVGGLAPHDEGSKGVGRYQVSADFRQGILKDTSKVALHISNINQFVGRKGRVDQVVSACGTKYMDGKGGESENYLDSITIPEGDGCFYHTKIIVNPYTKVTNSAINGNFTYFVRGEKGKEAYIDLGRNSQSNNAFVFNYTLKDIAAIDKSEENITFSFVEDFYNTEKKIDVNGSFNLTVSGADKSITTYHLNDSTKIVMGRNNVYAMQNTEEPIDSLVKDYYSIAEWSHMYVVVHSKGEVLTIGNSHHDILMNDPKARASHLVGGSGENVFVVTSGHEKLTLAKLPVSDVIIYDFDREDKIDTLDLRKIKEQLIQDIDREINTEISQIDSDLLINLSLDDASKKEVVKIRLKGALENNWYKRVHIVIDSIFVIEEILDDFELTPQPLIFDDKSKTIYVINPKDVEEGNKIRVKKEVGDYTFARDNDALVITNSLSSSADKNNLSTVMLNDFYHRNNRDKMQNLEIEFNDKKILLRKEIERINSAGNFSELKRKVRIDSYKAVMYEIKKLKLFEAIERNNIGEVKELINHGVSIDARNNKRQTPLHSAAFNGKLEVVKYLMEEKHVGFNVKDKDGRTPLHLAATNGQLEIVKYLVEKGGDVNVKDNYGGTLLQSAVYNGKLEVVKYLVGKGANVNLKDNIGKTPLHLAAINGLLEIVKYLVEKGGDVNVKDNSGVTPLQSAVYNGKLEVVKYLVGKGANVNLKDNIGKTPLHLAVINGLLEIVKYLVEKGGDVNVKDNSGVTPLQSAVYNGKLEVVKYLVGKGANVNLKDNIGKTPLHLAAINGLLEIVKYLVEKGGDVNVKDNSGVTPLHIAAMYGQLEVVKYLMEEKHVYVNVKDKDGRTPLNLAAFEGQLEIVKYLVEKGANVYAKNTSGQTPLHSAAINGQLEVVKCLMEAKHVGINVRDNVRRTPLHYAAINGNLEVVKHLVEKGANVNVYDFVQETPLSSAAIKGHLEIVKYLDVKGGGHNTVNIYHQGPLHLAAINGKLEVVKYLVGEGAHVNAKDNFGRTSLQFAAIKGHLEIVKYLVEKGADVNVKNNSWKTPLHFAASEGQLEVVKYLVEKGAGVNEMDDEGNTPLYLAAYEGQLEIVKYLVEKGAAVNIKDNSWETPLQYSVYNGNLQVVKYLVEKGADVNTKGDFGKTPLHIAAMYGQLEVVKYLMEEKHVDFNVKDKGGRTPLHLAASEGQLEEVKYLVEKGADVNVKNDDGRTALDLAADNRRSAVVEYLKRKLIEKRGKPQQRKRRHHHGDRIRHNSLRRSNIIDSSNQPEISTSNASQKSSWINDLVGWVKNSISGLLLGSRAALPETSGNYSNTAKNPGNQYTSQFSSEVCINNNVLLGFFLLQSFLDKKYPLPKFCSFTYEEALARTLNIVGEFEKTLEKTAKQSGVLVEDVNFYKVYLDIADHVWNERYSQIPNTLHSVAKEACSKNKKFLSILKGNIEKMLYKQQTVNSNNQEQGTANVDNKIPSFSLNSIVVERANNKSLKGVTCAGQVA